MVISVLSRALSLEHPAQHRQANDHDWLMHHVVAQTRPPERCQWPQEKRHTQRHPRYRSGQQPLPRSQTPPDDSQPGQHRHVVLCKRLAGHQAKPVQSAPIQQRRPLSIHTRQEQLCTPRQRQCNGSRQPKPAPPARGAPGHHQHDRHAMQHTEIDKALRKHHPRTDRHQHGAASNLEPAPTKPHPPLPLL